MRSRARTLLRLAPLLALALASCAPAPRAERGEIPALRRRERARAPEERSDAWPLWAREILRTERGATEHGEALVPLWESEITAERRVRVLRPLFSVVDDLDRDRRTVRALWPFFMHRTEGRSKHVFLMPLYYYRRRIETNAQGEEEEDRDGWIFPVIFWGGGRDGPHFAVFPLVGQLKGYFAKKYIRFFLFPLWMETHSQWYHAWHFPWPILGAWRGEDQRGWRIFPLVGMDRRDGKFYRFWALWPIVHYQKLGLDTRYPTTVAAAFPFWARIKNAHLSYVTVLWPFFGRRRDTRSDSIEWHAPWPVYSYSRAPGLRGLKFWPLWGMRRAPTRWSHFALWPLWGRVQERAPKARRLHRRVAVIFNVWTREWYEVERDGRAVRVAPPLSERELRLARERAKARGKPFVEPEPLPEGAVRRSTAHAHLWPLFRYQRDAQDRRAFQLLAPLWFGRRAREPFDLHYRPFWTLYSCRRAGGERRADALFTLLRHDRSSEHRRVRLLGVFDYKRTGERGDAPEVTEKRWRFLLGAFGYHRVGRRKRFRFLWIPFGRRLPKIEEVRGGAPEPEPAPAPDPLPVPEAVAP